MSDDLIMRIYLHEITDQETELDFSEAEKWLLDAVERVDERLDSGDESTVAPKPRAAAAPRPVQVHITLRKVDEVVVVSGDINTHIQLVCSRCANPFRLATHPSFSALFCKDPVMAGVAHLHRSPETKGKGRDEAPAKP